MIRHTFDFHAYLERLTGVTGWDVEELSGGAANYTVRVQHQQGAYKNNARSSASNAFGHGPVIVKQAPAFLAKYPELPFSPYRQTIEAEALHMFHSSSGLADVLNRNPCIQIPTLILHDEPSSLLVQSDLGSRPSLYDVLISSETSLSVAAELGKVVGHFMADMHNSSVNSPSLVDKFHNADAERVIEDVIRQATNFLQDAGIADYRSLGMTALEHWRTRSKTVFSQGDLWFGTVLVNVSHPRRADTVTNACLLNIGICDWEFAGPNDPAADIAQLGSYLHLLSKSSLTTSPVQEVILTFANALYSSYFSSLSEPPDEVFLRSLLIMHGWEMVNAAGWSTRQHMWCTCPGRGVRCGHVKAFIEEGAKLWRAATAGSEVEVPSGIQWLDFFPPSANSRQDNKLKANDISSLES